VPASAPAPASLLPRLPQVLRWTWERPLSAVTTHRAALTTALRTIGAGLGPGWSLRVALPFEVDDPIDELVALAHHFADADIGVDFAPRLAGNRALNTGSAVKMHARLLPALGMLIEQLSSSSLSSSMSPGVLLHLEPSARHVTAAWAARSGTGLAAKWRGVSSTVASMAGAVWMARQGRRDLTELAHDLRALPWPVLATSPPPLLPLDTIIGATALHWLLGCPDTSLWADDVDGDLFGPTAALCFAPLLATVMGARDRAEQHRALTLWAARHREKSHAVCVGPLSALAGIDVDNAVYVSAAHVRQDLRAVRALGFSDITITSLDGLVLAGDVVRNDVDAWVEAIVDSDVSSVAAAA